MATTERFLWATEVLNAQPTNNILEIGCGAGIFAEQIAGKLTTGKLVAVDKSKPMIMMAAKRNKRFVDNRRVEFLVNELIKTNFDKAGFDKVTAFNVNVFWKEPSKELALIRHYLSADGQLYLFYQAPYETDRKDAQPVIAQLEKNDFTILNVLFKKLKPASAFCIIAKSAAQ